MKGYYINVHYDAVAHVYVEAETEEDALRQGEFLAEESNLDYFLTASEVTNTVDIEEESLSQIIED